MVSQWTSCSIPGVWIRTLDRFEDARGENVVLYDGDLNLPDDVLQELVSPLGVAPMFVHDNCSISVQHVLRGVHTDTHAWRMMTCLVGLVSFAIVDCRWIVRFGNSEMLQLSERNRTQVLLPPLVGAAFYVISERAVMHYRWSLPYDLSRQLTFGYDDPLFGLQWPSDRLILSERDALASGCDLHGC